METAAASLTTLDTLDLIEAEFSLETALEQLREDLDEEPASAAIVEGVISTVERVSLRVIHGPDDVRANVRELADARGALHALGALGAAGEEAFRRIEAYLKLWMRS